MYRTFSDTIVSECEDRTGNTQLSNVWVLSRVMRFSVVLKRTKGLFLWYHFCRMSAVWVLQRTVVSVVSLAQRSL